MTKFFGFVRSVTFALLIGVLNQAHAGRGGDLINNGGGIAEKNVLYAYAKLEGFLHLCLSSEVCKISSSQQ